MPLQVPFRIVQKTNIPTIIPTAILSVLVSAGSIASYLLFEEYPWTDDVCSTDSLYPISQSYVVNNPRSHGRAGEAINGSISFSTLHKVAKPKPAFPGFIGSAHTSHYISYDFCFHQTASFTSTKSQYKSTY